jgi:hypothetical protein
MVGGKEYVEEESKVARAIENPDVADADAVSSVLIWERHRWSWLPKRGSSSLVQKVVIVDIIIWTLRRSGCGNPWTVV